MNHDEIVAFLLNVVGVGGGAAVVAYAMFQWLGKKWIEDKFARSLEHMRHQQAVEIQRLRVEIDAILSAEIKLQEREFEVLPEAWEKLQEAHGLVSWLVSPSQQFADVDRMSAPQLEEFLNETQFTDSQKQDIRVAQRKGQVFRNIEFWHRLHRVRKAFGELQSFVAKKGIFLPPDLEDKFSVISEMLWSAIVSKEVGHEAEDWKMQLEGWRKIRDEAEPQFKAIKVQIQQRLHSHAKRQ